MMPDSHSNLKPSLEDVLRLKRAERPSPEFWAGFERELRQKQLTALVQKRRWWHTFSQLSTRRTYLPVGATAVVAFALVAVRFNSPTRLVSVENTAARIESSDPAIEWLPPTVVVSSQEQYQESLASSIEAPAAGDEVVALSASMASHEDASPSARSIAANFARLEQSEPELVQAVIGNRLSSSSRATPAVASLDPDPTEVSQPTPRYRLIARYAERVLSPKPEAPDLVRQHLARRLGDDLGDDLSRIGLGGDRVSLKF
jgi:hypothetical protein